MLSLSNNKNILDPVAMPTVLRDYHSLPEYSSVTKTPFKNSYMRIFRTAFEETESTWFEAKRRCQKKQQRAAEKQL